MTLPHIGIDLGTTNTVMAACERKNEDIKVDALAIHQWDRLANTFFPESKYLPSVLYFGNKLYVGDHAKYMKQNSSDNVIYNSKLSIGTRNVLKKNCTPIMAATEIMKACKISLLKRYNIDSIERFESITVTVPASFNTNQVNDTIEAVKASGFVNAYILEEPAAALLYFLKSQQDGLYGEKIDFSKKLRILVYDIGGGTTDVCIADVQVNLEQLSGSIDFLITGRYNEFGGIDFDEIIAVTLLNNFFIEHGVDENHVSENEKMEMMYKLMPFCEKSKERLSSEAVQGMYGDPAEFNIDDFYHGNAASFSVNYKDFISAIEPLLGDEKSDTHIDFKRNTYKKNIVHPIKDVLNRLLERTKRQHHNIDYVLMTGGMSMLQQIRERIGKEFGIPIISIDRPMEAVALGAALFGYWKVKITNPEIRGSSDHLKVEQSFDKIISTESGLAVVSKESIENVPIIEIKTRALLNEAIFIDRYDDLPLEIIGAQTPIPVDETIINYDFEVKSPTGFILNLLAGQNIHDPEMRFLYSYAYEFSTLVRKGTKARVAYSIDENRYLQMKIIVMAETQMVFPLKASLD